MSRTTPLSIIVFASLITLTAMLPFEVSAQHNAQCYTLSTQNQVIHTATYSLILPAGSTYQQVNGQPSIIPVPAQLYSSLRRTEAGSDWTNAGGDAQRNGQSSTTGPLTNDTLWSGGPSSIISWLPVTEGNRLFIVRQAGWPGSQHDSPIYAMDLTTGEVLWSVEIPYDAGDWTTWIAGVKGGVVYASRSGNGASVHDNLYALNATTGATLWVSQQLIDAGPYDGVVFASNGDPIVASFTDIWRFNAGDGSVVWHATRVGSVSGDCGGALIDNAFYVADAAPGGHVIVRYDATTGERLYQSTVMPGFTLQNTPFIGPDGTVYLSRTQNNALVDFFYAFTDTGSSLDEKWHIPAAWTTFSEYGVASDGNVYAVIPGPRIAKVSSVNGSILAQSDVLTVDVSPAPHFAIDATGTVFFSNGGFTQGLVTVYTTDLQPVWSTPVTNINIGGPALGNNGILLVCGIGTNLRAYHQPLPAFSINMTGGLKLHVRVQNVGQVDATNLSWSTTLKGGVLKRINQTRGGYIPNLDVQSSINVTVGPFFGIGPLDVSFQVDQTSASAKGFIFGPWISIH